MNKPLKGFITYSHEDEQERKKLRTCLSVMEKADAIDLKDDTNITAGGEARQEAILKVVADSDILLYLVSADSLASENCNKELTEAVDAEIKVIPIILESCDWMNHKLSAFQALPDKGEPINEWQHESKGWQNIVNGIRNAVKEIYDCAIEGFNKVIELNPNDAKVYYDLGNTYHRKGDADHNKADYDLAIEAFTRAIELKPDYPEAYTNRGLDYVKKRNYALAIADHSKAIELKPNYPEAYFNRGGAYKSKGDDYQDKGDYDRAIADFTQAIQINSFFVGAYNHRGVAYRAKDDYDRAIADFTKAIEFNPDFIAEVYNNRGITYRKKGTIDRAIRDHNKAIECKTDFAEAYFNRGQAWLLLKEWERAKSDLTTAKEKGANIVDEFRMDYENVSDFEGKHDIQLPADIAAMLTPPQASGFDSDSRFLAHRRGVNQGS